MIEESFDELRNALKEGDIRTGRLRDRRGPPEGTRALRTQARGHAFVRVNSSKAEMSFSAERADPATSTALRTSSTLSSSTVLRSMSGDKGRRQVGSLRLLTSPAGKEKVPCVFADCRIS